MPIYKSASKIVNSINKNCMFKFPRYNYYKFYKHQILEFCLTNVILHPKLESKSRNFCF